MLNPRLPLALAGLLFTGVSVTPLHAITNPGPRILLQLPQEPLPAWAEVADQLLGSYAYLQAEQAVLQALQADHPDHEANPSPAQATVQELTAVALDGLPGLVALWLLQGHPPALAWDHYDQVRANLEPNLPNLITQRLEAEP